MQDEVIDLRPAFKTIVRSSWILVAGVIGGILIAGFTYQQSTLVYSSTAKLFVQGGQNTDGLSARDIDESRRISQLYGDLATTRPILNAVAENDNVPFSGNQLMDKISVSESRSFIEITARDVDPEMAATIANVAAVTLIGELSDRQIAQIAQIQDSLSQLGLDKDAAIVTAQAANLPILGVAEEALPSGEPINPNAARTRRLSLGGIIGLILAGGIVLIRSALDDSVKTEDDLAMATGLVVLGAIPKYRPPRNGTPILMNSNGRHHSAVEAYYIIRANMDYTLSLDAPIRSLVVTSPAPSEGKSTLASNLAVVFAKEGKSVILVDTDLRRPVQHQNFGIDQAEECGVTEILNGLVSVEQALVGTEVDGLKVITAGKLSEDVIMLLRSERLEQMKSRLGEIADLVVYDSPPVLAVSDPLLLAEGLDLTILVSEAGSTTRRAARRSAEALNRVNSGSTVAVLTKQRQGITGYENYGYSNYYAGGHVRNGTNKRRASAVIRFASRIVFWRARPDLDE